MSETTNREVHSGTDIAKHAGTTAIVRGTYIEIDVRKGKTGDAVHLGHAGIRLKDGTVVLLLPPAHADAKRSKSERDELRDKPAVAEGTLHRVCPDTGGASLQLPCLSPLLHVVDPELHEMLRQ